MLEGKINKSGERYSKKFTIKKGSSKSRRKGILWV
jgi:hypothetical protein